MISLLRDITVWVHHFMFSFAYHHIQHTPFDICIHWGPRSGGMSAHPGFYATAVKYMAGFGMGKQDLPKLLAGKVDEWLQKALRRRRNPWLPRSGRLRKKRKRMVRPTEPKNGVCRCRVEAETTMN